MSKTRKSILLTGGTGFFGKSFLSRLRRGGLPGIRLTLLARHPETLFRECPELTELPDVNCAAGDIRTCAFPDMAFDAIIHAATPSTPQPEGVLRDIIVNGTRNLLDYARRSGSGRLLFVSSGAVYGPQPQNVPKIAETHPCVPVTEYGIAKHEAERLCLESGLDTVIARCFAFTGPYLNRRIHFAVGNFIQACLDGREITVRGDGTPLRSYMYADDLVDWLMATVARGVSGQAYNVGSDEALSIRELAYAVREALGVSVPVRICGTPVPGAPVERYVPDIGKARRELGVDITVSLAEAIRRSAVRDGNASGD